MDLRKFIFLVSLLLGLECFGLASLKPDKNSEYPRSNLRSGLVPFKYPVLRRHPVSLLGENPVSLITQNPGELFPRYKSPNPHSPGIPGHLHSPGIPGHLHQILTDYVKDILINSTRMFFNLEIDQTSSTVKPFLLQEKTRNMLLTNCEPCYNSTNPIHVDFYRKDPIAQIDTTTEASEGNIEKLVDLLQEQSRQDHRQNQEEEIKEDKTPTKEQVGSYIYRWLGRLGLLVTLQKFKYNGSKEGVNLIGVLPGPKWGSNIDQIMIVSCYWDQVQDRSGLSLMLETARVITNRMKEIDRKNSIIFVAYDKSLDRFEGSKYFVSGFLNQLRIKNIKVVIHLESLLSSQIEDVIKHNTSLTVRNGSGLRSFIIYDRGTILDTESFNLFDNLSSAELIRSSTVLLQDLSILPFQQLNSYKESWYRDSSRFWMFNDTAVLSISAISGTNLDSMKDLTNAIASLAVAEATNTDLDKKDINLEVPLSGSEIELAGTFAKFLGTLVEWQSTIDERIHELTQLNIALDKKLGNLPRQNSSHPDLRDSNNLPLQIYLNTTGTNPYIALGHMETDTQVLKSIIEEYYGRSNDSGEHGEENSPMIIKILNPN
ncbi:uncharacterized protein LOC111712186 isoform X2 [Eurytemora carolleeae]|uniref:uncharacterized protein LOC111712186 isoform X2 n=1 Tax=Eurytemora carolleeae TaxID=1294199 RepID=UPI000C792F0D|nr:uncharacterized protein LOC111712186 isoform X2 [Eurytemora carolleeae]|eukprot:XP_023342499.1 uncharacterized protein LOC111712186 isoform X2 [Eurytemora affinis]